jgi:hypothetical protein
MLPVSEVLRLAHTKRSLVHVRRYWGCTNGRTFTGSLRHEAEEMLGLFELIQAQIDGKITNLKFVLEDDEVIAYFNPTKPVKYIHLNFIVTKTGISFSEVVNENKT